MGFQNFFFLNYEVGLKYVGTGGVGNTCNPIQASNTRWCGSVVKYRGQGQSGQAIKLFQITPYVSDFQNAETFIGKIYGSVIFLNNPGS